MTSSLFIASASLLLVAVVAIAVLLRRIHVLSIDVASVNERCAARESEAASLQHRLAQLQSDNDSLQSDKLKFAEDIVRLQTSLNLERKQFDEKLSLLNESRAQLSVAFKNIAQEIFEDKSKNFVEKNKDSLATILNPLQDKISQFQKRVEDTYDKESKERFSLEKEIKSLQELNTKISEDAINLTNALKGDNRLKVVGGSSFWSRCWRNPDW
jgi:DNA recombination protein RmuC